MLQGVLAFSHTLHTPISVGLMLLCVKSVNKRSESADFGIGHRHHAARRPIEATQLVFLSVAKSHSLRRSRKRQKGEKKHAQGF